MENLQTTMNGVEEWFNDWRLQPNPTKSQLIIFNHNPTNRGSHDLRSCRSSAQCRQCGSKKHHSLLCFDKHKSRAQGTDNALPVVSESQPTSNENAVLPVQPSSSTLLVGAGLVAKQSQTVLLATALVDVCDIKGNYHSLRCLLDSGSMTSFISQRAVNRLNLQKFGCSTELKGLGSMASSVNFGVTLAIKPVKKLSPILFTTAIILDKICDPMPTTNLSNIQWSHLADLQLADPHFARTGSVDLLIGADLFSKILLNERIYGADGEPDALNSIFGYILTGKINLTSPPALTSLFCASHEPSLETTMQQFWTVENVPSPLSTLTPDEETCESIFLETHSRDTTGRYTTLIFELNALMQLGGFDLRKWSSNDTSLLRDLPPSHVSMDPLTFNDTSSDLSVKIVLAWIRSQPHRFTTFVANRISYIQTKVPRLSWCYINTLDNPADVASRGILPRSFTSCHLWFQGPAFLYDTALISHDAPNLDDAALFSR
ncbi:hypothetical protein NQ317_015340 [Molorchus minor]|uniref:Peptidase aspartic putative domain-containing protein n=1 Tax=Molorchus minor TaxID=1323400 RepID=A0ABQ9J2Q4_9CUCU|nr:hypothetical protein NQ317_015340 [Molorchus minor]